MLYLLSCVARAALGVCDISMQSPTRHSFCAAASKALLQPAVRMGCGLPWNAETDDNYISLGVFSIMSTYVWRLIAEQA